MRRASSSALRASSSGIPGAGAITVSQTPPTCWDSTTGYATAWPCGERTTFAASSRTKSTFSSASTGTAGAEGLGRLLQGAYEPDPLAVVAAADGLQDHRKTVALGAGREALGREGGDVGDVAHDPVPWAGHAERVELGAHHTLVLGVHERVGARTDGNAVRLQGTQMLAGHMFVIEGDHIAAPREVTQRVEVAVVADDDIADHLRRGILRGVTEELEPDAERDARLVCHTSELTPADHADYRERHAPRVSATPRRPDSALRAPAPARPAARSSPCRAPRARPVPAPSVTRFFRTRESAHRHDREPLVSMAGLK